MPQKHPRILPAARPLTGSLAALMGAGALAAGPAIASNTRAHHHGHHAKSSDAKQRSESQITAADNRLHAAAAEAVERLVRAGTIDQHQADVIDGQVDAGSVYPEELVARGIVSESQMQAVDSVLAEVKESFANHP